MIIIVPIFLLLVVTWLILSQSLLIVKDRQRVAIFRMGQLHRIVGPGIVVQFPVLDKSMRVNLDEAVPDWQTLSKVELTERIKSLFRAGEVPPGVKPA
jgi:regulator of protease activity HflC (stomatin/prohibitin superfamily)